jgi:hypothetical protein
MTLNHARLPVPPLRHFKNDVACGAELMYSYTLSLSSRKIGAFYPQKVSIWRFISFPWK